MERDRIWTLIAAKLSGSTSAAELAELESLLRADPEMHYYLQVVEQLWESRHGNDAPAGKLPEATFNEEAAYNRMLKKMKSLGIDPPGKAQTGVQPVATAPTQYQKPKGRQQSALLLAHSIFRNNLKTSWCNLFRNKTFSIINISGLALGMAAAILILLWIQNQLSFDRFHRNGDRIYQVYSQTTVNGTVETWQGTSMLLAPVLLSNYPEVEAAARTNWVGAFIFHTGDKHLQAQGLITDSGFLKIFDFPLVYGNVHTALSDTRSLVITETFARKLFNRTDVVGETVRIDSTDNFVVKGVLKDLPNNTRFRFDYLLPWSYNKEVNWDRPDWESTMFGTYVLLKPGVSEETANQHFSYIARAHASNANYDMFLHPIRKWQLWSHFENGKIVGGDIEGVRLFAGIAAIILLIACINYMNLSTARSVKRAKEVGIRKVTGAGRPWLIGWFIAESVLISTIAAIFALVIVHVTLPWFNKLINNALVVPYHNIYFWLSGACFILLTGILAGSYPAFYLSAFKPVKVLKGAFAAASALITPRKLLVVLQFTAAIVLIISTVVIYRQIVYGQSRDVGYNKDNLVFAYMKGDIQKRLDLLRKELFNSGAVTGITCTNSPITDIWNGDHTYTWEGKDPNTTIWFAKYHTDGDFVKTMGMQLLAGRDLDVRQYPTDSNGVLLNESAVKVMGFKDPVGQTIRSQEGTFHVVGVVKDFIPEAPYSPVEPTIIQGPGAHYWYGTITFKLSAHKPKTDNLATIAAVWEKYNPDYPFDYYFVDEQYALKFTGEKSYAMLGAVFAGLTIFISCLGLFALAAYMAENRVKEIGVRKVLGASVIRITVLLSKEFLKLVVIAFIIASPLAWWAMHNWLQAYAYRISIGWGVFAITGIVSILIALVTVSFQSVKAALASPVKALRSE